MEVSYEGIQSPAEKMFELWSFESHEMGDNAGVQENVTAGMAVHRQGGSVVSKILYVGRTEQSPEVLVHLKRGCKQSGYGPRISQTFSVLESLSRIMTSNHAPTKTSA